MSGQHFGDINIAKVSRETFNDTLVGDMLIYTESDQQRIHMGTVLGASPTLSVSKSNVVVAGSIIPNSNVAYDLGSYDFRFRDLYLSGSTIDLGGTMIQNDERGIVFKDSNNNLRSVIVDELVIGDPNTSNLITIRQTDTGILDIATATGLPSDITACNVFTVNMISSNITTQSLSAIAIDAASLTQNGINVALVNHPLAVNSVGTLNVIDSNITQSKLATDSVGTTQLINASVTNSKLAINSVSSNHIMDSNVTLSKMSINSIGNLQLLDLSVTQAKLSDYSVGTLQLIDSNVTRSKLADNSIITSHISTEAVTQTKLATNSVGTIQIIDSNVTLNKLAVNSVGVTNIVDGSITQPKMANNAIGTNQIADGAITFAKLSASTMSDALLSKPTFQLSNLSVYTTVDAVNGSFSNLGVTNSLTIGGNLTVNGNTTVIDTQTLLVEDNIITLNKNQVGTPATFLQSGIEVERGDEPNYYFMFDEVSDYFKIGLSNSLQAVCTRDDALVSGYPYFDSAQAKLINRAFTTSDIPDNIITTSKIVNGAITGAKLASNIYTSNIGIGNMNPQYPLDVTGSAVISGSVGIGTSNAPAFKLQVVGDIQATGNVIAYSDERFKTDLQIIQNALDKVMTIHGYTFKRVHQQNDKREAGVIAQEIAKVLPEVVVQDRDGYFSVAYGNITALLIEAFHDVHKRLSNIEAALTPKV